MIFIKILILLACAVCKYCGEIFQHNFQRFVMPVILALGVSIVTHTWWLGITCLPMIAPICLGYSNYGKMSDGFDRAMWLGMICVTAGLGSLIAGHLAWYFFTPWCILGFIWGGISRGWWNVVVAPISGALIGSLIFLVH